MYQALYRKWRPKTFSDVVGQEHVTETLQRQVAEGRLSHAYLFTGTRGTGKTTCAKILAKAVNCEHPENGNPCNKCSSCLGIESGGFLDVMELDAASNNGVDHVRALRDEAIYSPAQVKKRVYIIDEVHMLSIAAFNALLKILEEPPEHLMFILATTELHKVPATILSRCQRFAFRRILPREIVGRLNYIAEQFISYMVFYPLRSGAEPQSAKVAAMLPKLYQGSRINLGVVIALVLTVVYAVVIRRTRFGYHLRALGGSQKAAAYSGVNKSRYFFLAMLISGAFCGLAGAVQISGNTRRLMEGVAGDFGFSGIVVAMLGSLHPVGIVVAALFMALISAGSVTMQVKTGIPVSFTSVLEALIVLFILLGMAVSAAQSKRKKVR